MSLGERHDESQVAPVQLVLLSGLAADASIFTPQKLAFPNLVIPSWPVPLPSDTLDTYGERLAKTLSSDATMIIGGASFGGIVALHLAKQLKPLAVLLIGSIQSPSELPRYARAARLLRHFVPLLPVRLLQWCIRPATSKLANRWLPHLSGLARQFRGSNPIVFKWSLQRILDWETAPVVTCPIFHIHGNRDGVLPIKYTKPGTVVAGGGHVISLTHPREVNEFIRDALQSDRLHPSS